MAATADGRRPTVETRSPSRGRLWLEPGIFIGALVPLASLVHRGAQGQLGADPVALVENETGLVALIFLLASLACTPARHLFGWTWQIGVRRQLGLWAFFYAVLHLLAYVLVDQVLNWGVIIEDIVERPFITVGMLALVLMIPLAITSTKSSVRRLGFKRWQLLHRLSYLAGALAVLHFILRVKVDLTQPLTYASILAALLAVRLAFWLKKRRPLVRDA